MRILKEFKEFAMRGNVVDLAIGVIIGGAFGKIVTSLVNDVIMPPIGFLMGGVNFADKKFVFQVADSASGAAEIALNWGLFMNAVIDFIIVAFVIFLAIRAMNKLKRPEPEKTPATKECPFCKSVISHQALRCPHCTSELTS